MIASVHVGVVEEYDAGVSRGSDEDTDLLIVEYGDPHESKDDVRSFESRL